MMQVIWCCILDGVLMVTVEPLYGWLSADPFVYSAGPLQGLASQYQCKEAISVPSVEEQYVKGVVMLCSAVFGFYVPCWLTTQILPL